MTDWYYKLLPELPHIPEELIQLAYGSIDSEENFQHSPDRIQIDWNMTKNLQIIVDGKEKRNRPALAWHVDEELKRWAYENITDVDVAHVRISAIKADDEHDTCGAHVDRAREYALLYVIEDGGPNNRTVFYREDGQTIIREKAARCNDHSKLTELDSISIPPRTWCLLNVRVMHGVRNLNSRRVSIQVGLDSLRGLGIE
jgi:hypothetical protein